MADGGEDNLICDFAQYYRILDWRGVPLRLAATLAFGLPVNSRVQTGLAGIPVDFDTMLLARISDTLACILYKLGGAGEMPPSVLDGLTGRTKAARNVGFSSREEFDAFWKANGGG